MSIVSSYIVPHPPMIINKIGNGREKQIEKTINSYEEIAKEIGNLKPDTIIITSPHAKYYSNHFYIMPGNTLKGNFECFGVKEISFEKENDISLIEEIESICSVENISCGRLEEDVLDHGTMIPLYFISKYLPRCKIVVIGLSYLSLDIHYKLGEIIKRAVDKIQKKVVFVASGDLSHKLQAHGPYGFTKEGPIYDDKVCSIMKNCNFEEFLEFDELFLEKAAECGHRSFTIMSGIYDKMNVSSSFLSHEDITGVGYAICKFYPKNENTNRDFRVKYLEKVKNNLKLRYSNCDNYIKLAKDSIYNYVKFNRIIDIPVYIDSSLINNRAAVFVSIHKFGRLRGCIGTIIPTKNNIAKEIIDNAISAASNDYRFDKIDISELDYLEINVDVLTSPTKIDSKDKLDVKKYGVIVTSGLKRGLLLPDLDGVDTVDEQIEIAMNKGNISRNEKYELERFEVIRHKI